MSDQSNLEKGIIMGEPEKKNLIIF